MITDHCCIRVLKEAIPLVNKGYEIDLLSRRLPAEWRYFRNYLPWSYESLAKIIQDKKDIDIFHCHNQPTKFIKMVLDSTDKPVVADIHDFDSIVNMRYIPIEKEILQRAAKIIFPTKEYIQWAEDIYDIDIKKKTLILYSYCSKTMLPALRVLPSPAYKELVYEGGIHSYRSLSCFKKVNIYMNVIDGFLPEQMIQYQNSSLYMQLEYPALVQKLSEYAWGLTGSCYDNYNIRVSMPNKLFEYIAAGIPIISYMTDEVSKFIKEHEIGIAIPDPDQVIPDYVPYRENVQKIRDQFWMEDHIKSLENLYKEIL